MTSKRLGTILIAAAMLLTLVLGGAGAVVAQPTSSHTAQTYSFNVPTLLMQVAIQTDGSVNIVYDITFDNFGSPIDIVDIGTPTDNYDVNEMQASIDGQALTDIRPSEYIDTGVEVHLDGYAIPTGATGTLHLAFTIPDMVYADTTNQDNASLQITPTWFDSSLVSGTGNIEIRIATLPGIQPDEVLYQDQPFTDKYQDEQGRVVAVWQFENVSPTKAYRVGISFPQRGITNVIKVTFWDLLGRWLVGAVSVVGGAIGACVPLAAPLIVIFVIVRAVIRGSKPNYLPPIAQVEGGGIKRGLTAPEAAAILELPLTKVLGLVIFGMLEKGLIRQTKPDPLTVEVVEDFRVADKSDLKDEESRNRYRRQAAQTKGTVIHQYEYPFLDMIEKHPDTPINKMPVVEAMQSLVDGAAAKMKGFDLSDTQDYYRRVIDRAVEQAAAIGDVEQRQAYLDKYLPWVMMRARLPARPHAGWLPLLAGVGAANPCRFQRHVRRWSRWTRRFGRRRPSIHVDDHVWGRLSLLRGMGRDDDGRYGCRDSAYRAEQARGEQWLIGWRRVQRLRVCVRRLCVCVRVCGWWSLTGGPLCVPGGTDRYA